jgi:hypothetical protein
VLGARIINECEAVVGMIIGKGSKYLERTYPIATLSSTNPTLPDQRSNLGSPW